MKVFVTGATGLVGSHLCDALLADGHEVWALVRSPEKLSLLSSRPRAISGGLCWEGENPWMEQLPHGLQAIYHVAGIVHHRDPQQFHRINALATQRLVIGLRERFPSAKFVLVSSLAARNPVSQYGQSKLAAEQWALKEAPPTWRTLIIRPPMVIGPRDQALVPLFRLALMGIVPVMGLRGGLKRYSYIGVFDLVSLLLKALHRGEGMGYVAYPTSATLKEIVQAMAFPKVPWPLPLPRAIIELLARTSWIERLTPDKVQEMIPDTWECSGSEMAQQLGGIYQWDLKRILEATKKDYLQRGWIKGGPPGGDS